MSRIGPGRARKNRGKSARFRGGSHLQYGGSALAGAHETVITTEAANALPRRKNVHRCALTLHAAPNYNSAIPVAAVELIVYADYADADR
jgi:hypothetical protein